jgi:hypothetical protein
MEQIIKTLILLGSLVVGVWAIEARYASAKDVMEQEATIRALQGAITSNQDTISSNQKFLLEDKKGALEVKQFILERDERSEIEEFQYQQNSKRLESIEGQLQGL